MPAKKKKKNSPVKAQISQKQRKQQDTYKLVTRVVVATLVSSVLTLLISVWASASAPGNAAPGGRVFQFLPPFVGIIAAFSAPTVKEFLHTSPSDTVHAALISGLLSLVISGLVILLA